MITEIPSSELNQTAFNALFEKLGYSNTIRFLSQYREGSGDSVIQKDENFKGQSVDQIFEAVKANRAS